MKKNMTARSVIIVATILLCVYGIIGFPTSGAAIKQNFQNNIRLGLDLKGASHLVLEVQVQDAVKADVDQTLERLKQDLKKQNITWNSMDRNDPQSIADADKVEATIKGIPTSETSAFKALMADKYAPYILTRSEERRVGKEYRAGR